MDAGRIWDRFKASPGTLEAQLEHGAGLSAIEIRKVARHGLAFTASYVPDLNMRVKIHVDCLAAEATVITRNDVRASVLFLRPA